MVGKSSAYDVPEAVATAGTGIGGTVVVSAGGSSGELVAVTGAPQ